LCIFSKFDLKPGYYQMMMRDRDDWKTAFKIKYGLYEWLVMLFRLTIAPSTFMRLINHVLCVFIRTFVVMYFDDLLVCSRHFDKHMSHLRYVVDVLKKEKLYDNFKKCNFYMDNVIFLHFIVIAQDCDFNIIKDRLCSTPLLSLLDYIQTLKIECDA